MVLILYLKNIATTVEISASMGYKSYLDEEKINTIKFCVTNINGIHEKV